MTAKKYFFWQETFFFWQVGCISTRYFNNVWTKKRVITVK